MVVHRVTPRRSEARASGPSTPPKEYEVLKRRAAQLFPDSIHGYLFLKDPVFHIIYEAACLWARTLGWAPDDDYL
jgi:hypothetical protein